MVTNIKTSHFEILQKLLETATYKEHDEKHIVVTKLFSFIDERGNINYHAEIVSTTYGDYKEFLEKSI